MRKVFLKELPKRENGRIIWDSCVGIAIPFIYDEVEGNITITEHKDCKVRILYNGCQKWIRSHALKMGYIGDFVGATHKYQDVLWRYSVGEIIKDEKRDITILKRVLSKKKFEDGREHNIKKYIYKCNKCGYINDNAVLESNLYNHKHGCPSCANNTLIIGKNDIATTSPWMLKYLVNKADAHTHTSQTNKKINVKCPYCGRTKAISPSDLFKRKGIGCICEDGHSYPEKFFYNLLEQLNIDFIWQFSNKNRGWCRNYKYDFYIPSIDCIVETHGAQHYIGGFGNKEQKKENLKKEQQNDFEKYDNAIKNVQNYVVINCSISNATYITENILHSNFAKLIDMSNVDFKACDEFATRNFIKNVCDYVKNNPEVSISQLAEQFRVARTTITKYLKTGEQNGWCHYNAQQMKEKGLNSRREEIASEAKRRKEKVLEYIKSHKDMSTKQLVDIFQVSDTTIRKYKRELSYTQ